jgi:RNA polymerase sigma-70 factor (ECF subfamily)
MAPSIYTDENDLILFHKIKEDSQGAFKILFLRYYDKLSGFVVLLHHDASLAEEVVQEVFARIWEKRHEIDIKTSVKYYLYNACRNQAYNLISQKVHQHSALSRTLEDIIADDQNPEKIFSFEALNHDFHEAINTLPAKAKEVFLLKYFEKARHREIAQSMNISESMVEKHAANALRHLRKKLEMHAISVFFALSFLTALLY